MAYIWLAIYGLIAGVVARALIPGKEPLGFIMSIALGIAGSILAGFIMSLFGLEAHKGFSLYGMIPAVSGAVAILLIFKFAKRL